MAIKMVRTSNLTLEGMFQQLQNYNQANNLTQATKTHYRQYYLQFANFLGKDTLVKEINQDTITNYTNRIRSNNPNISDTSINTAIRAVRIFINFGIERGYIQPFKIKTIKADKPIKEFYKEQELKLLLRKPDIKHCNFAELRNWVLISFMVGTGARRSTILAIKIKDFDIASKEIILRHMKNHKQLIIPISSSLCNILVEYLRYRGGNSDDFLFCEANGGELTPNGLKFAIRRYNQRRGVERTSIHAFRHTFARMAVIAGMPAFQLMRLLGHSNITTTQNYVNMFGTDLHYNYDQYNPLEALTEKKQYIKLK